MTGLFHLQDAINQNTIYFIAEMSANHGGSLENALEIVRQAAKAGADCLKIQTYTADSMTIDCNNEYFMIKGGLWDGYRLYDLYRQASTPYEWQGRIKEACDSCGIDFLSTPFDRNGVDFLEQLGVEAYKIASFELVDIPLIEYAASKGKLMIISTGMGNIQEIQDAVDACKRVGNEQIVLLKCCSEYPAPWEDMCLGDLPDMRERFQVPVGLSDHSAGSLGAVVGVTLGACVVEKHVRLEGVESADSKFSMTMDEFAQMVREVRNAKMIAKSSKGAGYSLTEGEKASMVFRRSIFAVKDIGEGEMFTKENLRVIRPGYGISPKCLNALIGERSKREIRRGEPIKEQDMHRGMDG
ncbi:MAG: pseudaminic acid synthase [Hungatella sp.]|nr:pseudaminic acid synthase [Hungatella sp.]